MPDIKYRIPNQAQPATRKTLYLVVLKHNNDGSFSCLLEGRPLCLPVGSAKITADAYGYMYIFFLFIHFIFNMWLDIHEFRRGDAWCNMQ